jgi:hypothetical protein
VRFFPLSQVEICCVAARMVRSFFKNRGVASVGQCCIRKPAADTSVKANALFDIIARRTQLLRAPDLREYRIMMNGIGCLHRLVKLGFLDPLTANPVAATFEANGNIAVHGPLVAEIRPRPGGAKLPGRIEFPQPPA